MNNFSPANFKRLYFDLCVLFLVSAIIVLPVFVWGVPNGADTSQHYQFARTFFDSIQNGNFYPSWASTTNHGFGDVGIRFYPPFAYYVMVGFRYLSGNWYDASVLSFLFWFFLGGVGMYFWCREWFGENASLAAGIIYIFMPYHVNQLYNAFMYGEFAGSAILPFCFLFVTRICRNGKFIDVIGLAFFYALLVLTHIPLTILGSISLLIYSMASLRKKDFFPHLLRLATAVFLGLLASSFYWLRMVTELDFVKHASAEFTSNLYDFHTNFIFSSLHTLLLNSNTFSSLHCDLLLLITLGIITPSVVIFYLWSKDKNNQKLFNVAIVLIFSIFIATPYSNFVWENLPVLQKVQFPWRWLAVVSMTSAVFVAAGFDILIGLFSTKKRPVALLTCGLFAAGIIFTLMGVVNHSLQMPRQDFTEQTKNLLNSGSFNCWLPVWSKSEAIQSRQKVLAEDRSAQIIVWQPIEREIVFVAGKPTDARIATFYYPHWTATVNGQPTELKRDENGTMLVPLPAEAADVKIWFQEPIYVRAASYISILTWVILSIIGLFIFRKNKSHQISEFGQNAGNYSTNKNL